MEKFTLDFLLDFIFPSSCLGCGVILQKGAVLCPKCLPKISRRDRLACGLCRARIPGGKPICHASFPFLLAAASDYGDPVVQKLIKALKFHNIRRAAEPLGEIIADFLKNLPFSFQDFTIIPLPLGKSRLRRRGYNQSELIAKTVSELMGLPVDASILKRTSTRPPQSGLEDFRKRFENVRGAFQADAEAAGKNVLLLDDVITSGATLTEAAKTLKAAGARRIVAAVAASA